MSIARRTFPSRLELKRRAGSFSDAPLAKVSFTTFLYDSPVQMMPSCDQIGVPIHFHSSTTSGSASLMSLRILLRVSPRQSPSSAILCEIRSDADWPWLAPDFVMFSPRSSRDTSFARQLVLLRLRPAGEAMTKSVPARKALQCGLVLGRPQPLPLVRLGQKSFRKVDPLLQFANPLFQLIEFAKADLKVLHHLAALGRVH